MSWLIFIIGHLYSNVCENWTNLIDVVQMHTLGPRSSCEFASVHMHVCEHIWTVVFGRDVTRGVAEGQSMHVPS